MFYIKIPRDYTDGNTIIDKYNVRYRPHQNRVFGRRSRCRRGARGVRPAAAASTAALNSLPDELVKGRDTILRLNTAAGGVSHVSLAAGVEPCGREKRRRE
ncbi:hypothetical protein EVAR_41292_1 [Eumeta japonica]|uniref:Uncharacterized protein n=1 Tax=Eumeta variegata TaxID=151549 RepID=A0A4C1XAB7_EUMVA|nr:hypothetical protein EVAR_41292_1 [Eumeta japonica]